MSIHNLKSKFTAFVLISAFALMQTGCSFIGGLTTLVGINETATVIANTAQIRSSYAVVAADLLEVKRGEKLDVLDQNEFEKVLWFRVRAHDDDNTEGWIEAQNVITQDTLEKSQKLASEFKDQPPQAAGQLRAASNLRLVPDMTSENVLFKLANGSTFEVMDWKFVPKEQTASDVDDAPKGEQKQSKAKTKNAEIEAAKEDNEPDKIDDKYDIWYEVRLDPSVSPAPAGWLFGRQVELQVPSDIVFYQQNDKKFVTWYRLDNDSTDKVSAKDKTTAPGSWIILTRSNLVKAIDGVEPDFDGIMVLGYDKYDQDHYMVFRTPNDASIWGLLPLRVDGTGDNKTFSLQLRANGGGMQEKRFVVTKDAKRTRVTPPADLDQFELKPK